MTNTKLLEEAINASGYKRSYLAAKLGITPYALAKKIRNENQFKASEIDLMSRLLKIDVNTRMKIFFAKKVD